MAMFLLKSSLRSSYSGGISMASSALGLSMVVNLTVTKGEVIQVCKQVSDHFNSSRSGQDMVGLCFSSQGRPRIISNSVFSRIKRREVHDEERWYPLVPVLFSVRTCFPGVGAKC